LWEHPSDDGSSVQNENATCVHADGIIVYNSSFVIRPWRLAMNEVTHILSAIEHGDPHAAEQLLPLVYDELRKLAAQTLAQDKPGQTLEATALVHEAYLRVVGTGDRQAWDSRGHFFAADAEVMRRILVENARRRQSLKRGGAMERVDFPELVA